jgi:hypothetical protein
MAAPGLGYVKRDVEKTTVDWGAISGGLTTALGGAFAAGEKQKAAVAVTDQAVSAEIQKLPKGATPDQTKYYAGIIQKVGDGNQKIKDQYDNGEISATQYKIATNALTSQYQILKNNLVNYQSSYDKLRENVLKEGTGNVSLLMADIQTTLGDLANKTVDWNMDSMMLESVTNVNGQIVTQPVANDLGVMNFYNKEFNMDIINKANLSLGKFSTTVTKDGVRTKTINYDGKEFNNSLDGIVNSAISDANGIDALEYLSGPGGKKLVLGTPAANEIQVKIDNKTKQPIAVDLDKVISDAKKGLRKEIIGSLDRTYERSVDKKDTDKAKAYDAQFEITFLPNRIAAEQMEANRKAKKPYKNIVINRMQNFDDPTMKILKVGQVTDPVALKSYPKADFFVLKNTGKLQGVTIQSKSQIENFMNELQGLTPERIDEYKKDIEGYDFYEDNGVIKYDTPETQKVKGDRSGATDPFGNPIN